MAMIPTDDLPTPTADVLRRRARAAGLSMNAHIRGELIELAGRRVPLDAVVEFLDAERRGRHDSGIDADAMAVIRDYDLPAQTWSVLARRAGAVGMPLSAYIRQELITSARRTTVYDVALEMLEVQQANQGVVIDMSQTAIRPRVLPPTPPPAPPVPIPGAVPGCR
ncbi:hypothetical protein [Nocardia kruczakiae]|uniref:hypothetical protein n=1 Tax=Nocardia kruczakiae TaxID=261477 RepID=UPI0012ECD030|nr:hypothetical protein [Nocardia kruczakiae]